MNESGDRRRFATDSAAARAPALSDWFGTGLSVCRTCDQMLTSTDLANGTDFRLHPVARY